MPVVAPAVAAAILAAGPDLTGSSFTRLATVVGIALSAWAPVPANVVIQGVTTGAAGAGAVTGKLYVVPAPLPVSASALAVLFGNIAPSVARAIGVGVANALNASALYQGASAGVGSGADVSKVSFANGMSLVAALSLAATSTAFSGVDVPRICAALGPGIAALLLTGSGIGVVAGPVGPAPGVGTSLSWVT